MLEYVFFQEATRKRFQEFLTDQGLAWTLEHGDLDTLVIVDEAGLDDELAERLESMYDELFAAEQTLHGASRRPGVRQDEDSGVVIKLRDGRALATGLPAELVDRVLTVITPEELVILAEGIALATTKVDGHAP